MCSVIWHFYVIRYQFFIEICCICFYVNVTSLLHLKWHETKMICATKLPQEVHYVHHIQLVWGKDKDKLFSKTYIQIVVKILVYVLRAAMYVCICVINLLRKYILNIAQNCLCMVSNFPSRNCYLLYKKTKYKKIIKM